jgi:hypothetical protein
MRWAEMSSMSRRRELVMPAGQEGANIPDLCRQPGAQARIGGEWLERRAAEGERTSAADQRTASRFLS